MYSLDLCTLHLTERKFIFWNKLRLINSVMCLGTLPYNLQPLTTGRELASADPRVVRSCKLLITNPCCKLGNLPPPPTPTLKIFIYETFPRNSMYSIQTIQLSSL